MLQHNVIGIARARMGGGASDFGVDDYIRGVDQIELARLGEVEQQVDGLAVRDLFAFHEHAHGHRDDVLLIVLDVDVAFLRKTHEFFFAVQRRRCSPENPSLRVLRPPNGCAVT